jgi:hypothetical protein
VALREKEIVNCDGDERRVTICEDFFRWCFERDLKVRRLCNDHCWVLGPCKWLQLSLF